MVRGARSVSNFGRRMSSGRGFSTASGTGQFTPPPPTVAGPSVSAPPAFLAGASTVPEVEDVVSL
ncbi:hypothetical protein Taro_054541 [Colocasia esculenta]|uniref:Uncharacterized protein n=1 Tax=Colocasia esculenta TaxID=4460 RepID=A0A843XP36_COLES|nr:hypothetical protein [Colocasia esculenta]